MYCKKIILFALITSWIGVLIAAPTVILLNDAIVPSSQSIIMENPNNSVVVNATPPLIDGILIFTPDTPQLEKQFNLTRNNIYEIAYRAYIPFTSYNISLILTDPFGIEYILIQTMENLTVNYTTHTYQYLTNENGCHRFKLQIEVSTSLTFYLLFHEVSNLSQFIRNNAFIPSDFLMEDQHSETFLINVAKIDHTFYFPLIPDIEYNLIYFRGVGIPVILANQTNFVLPTVKIEMWFGGHYFVLAPNFSSLAAFNVGGDFALVKFAVWQRDVAQIKISTNASILNLNYGFSIYSVKEIGNGPDEIPLEQPPLNTTSSTNETTPTDNQTTNLPPSPENSTKDGFLDKFLGSINIGIHQYGDNIIITAIVGIGAVLGIPYIKQLHKVKPTIMEEGRE